MAAQAGHESGQESKVAGPSALRPGQARPGQGLHTVRIRKRQRGQRPTRVAPAIARLCGCCRRCIFLRIGIELVSFPKSRWEAAQQQLFPYSFLLAPCLVGALCTETRSNTRRWGLHFVERLDIQEPPTITCSIGNPRGKKRSSAEKRL